VLQRVLELLGRGTVQTQHELAEALGASESLIILVVEQLAQRGYLAEANQCADGCVHCPMQQACGGSKDLRAWMLTEKGKAAIHRPYELTFRDSNNPAY
jgi:DNA-binding transcriptional MocR family regulator